MSWLNSDAYNIGFEKGKQDAIAGNKRNVLEFKAGLKGLFAFNNTVYMDTYMNGYKEGYRVGLTIQAVKEETEQKPNKIHQTTISNNIKSNSMQRGIDGQIELLEQMKNFLSNLTQQFDEITKTQESFVRGLDSEGLDFKLLENFENSVEDNRNKINALVSDIENEQIPYTEKVIRHLEDTPR